MRRAWVDLFCGAGGVSIAAREVLGEDVAVAVNHWPVAIAVHAKNHPATRHITTDVREVDPRTAVGKGVDVYGIWASPDCTHHSVAKGGKPRDNDLRSLPDVLPIWLRDLRPDVAFCENVPELQSWGPLDEENRPIRARRGEEFQRWIGEIRALGYVVDWRVLDASRYGAPTRRRRLFVVARRDGLPIVWPEPTHGAGLLPFHTAAECIDWSLPCPSIFERKRPLAEKTLWRIAQGLKRFVFENPRPFIVKVNHGIDTKTGRREHSVDEPLTTVTASGNGHALVAPTLVQTGYGERDGQTPRALDLHAPLGTVVGCGQKHALVSAFLAKHFGDPLRKDGGGGVVVGSQLDLPIGTVTARDHHTLAAVALAKFNGNAENGHPGCSSVEEPLSTITAGGIHVAEVRAFLMAYYRTGSGQELLEPLRTLTTKHRLGLVTVSGVDYQIVDIGLRMLEPHELLRAQFGKYAAAYDLSAAKTKADQVRLIGNSVPPELAEALIAANVPHMTAVAA